MIQILTLILVGYYCWLVYSWRSVDPDNKQTLERFVNFALVLGVVIVGVAAAKIIGSVGFAASVIAAFIVWVQVGLLRTAGNLTLRRSLVEELLQTKKNHLALLAMLAAPPILLYTGMNPLRDQIMVYIVMVELVAISAIFLGRTLQEFVRQKVSLLVWFLYLCTVEIFPVSFVVVLAVKNA